MQAACVTYCHGCLDRIPWKHMFSSRHRCKCLFLYLFSDLIVIKKLNWKFVSMYAVILFFKWALLNSEHQLKCLGMIVSLYIGRDKTPMYTIYQSSEFVLQVALDGLCHTLQKNLFTWFYHHIYETIAKTVVVNKLSLKKKILSFCCTDENSQLKL